MKRFLPFLQIALILLPFAGIGCLGWKFCSDMNRINTDCEISDKIARDRAPYQLEVGDFVRPATLPAGVRGVIIQRRKSKYYDFDWGTVGEYRLAYRNVYTVHWFYPTWDMAQADAKPELKVNREQQDFLEPELTKLEK
jgi:hypothetical protein